MTAPTNPYNAITAAEKQAGKPGKEELFDSLDLNNERLWEVMLAAGVSPGDAAVALGHRHLGPAVDGTATITPQPQENLLSEGDLPDALSWSYGPAGPPAGELSFPRAGSGELYQIKRSEAPISFYYTFISRGLLGNTLKKIKSAGGKGRFSCSMHMKRVPAAAGVVGGVLRFGIYDGAAFVSGAHADIDFDDVAQEYKRFYFVSNQITRPAALNLRAEWITQPTDWDTISNGDLVGYNGGYMVTNGAGVPKWDISHFDGAGDIYHADPNDLAYWWDENITEEEQTVIV